MSLFHIHTQVGSSLKESRRVVGRPPHAGQRLDVLYPMPTTHDSLFFAGKNLVCMLCTRHQNSVLLGQHASSVELASVNNKVD